MKENEYKDARDFFCALPRTTTRTKSSAANDYYAPSSSCADDDIAPSCLDGRHAHSMLVSTTNQKRAVTSSSLKIEEVEKKASVANQDGRQWGSNLGL